MTIRAANLSDIPVIKDLAHSIWWPAYKGILPPEQIAFMLADMYSEEALQQQFAEGHTFLLVENDEGSALGFASFSLKNAGVYKIHKLYVLPSEQGRGLGVLLIAFIREIALQSGAEVLELNVNRDNTALGFYRKLGFSVYRQVDIPYRQFVLNDYVMRMSVTPEKGQLDRDSEPLS